MADTPAPLPSLGLLDGLGTAATGNTDSPAPLPSLALLGGLGTAVSVAEEPPLAWTAERIPGAWYVDPGFSAAYAWHQTGILVANRDEVAQAGNQGGDPAPLPHLGLLLGEAPPPEPEPDTLVGRPVRRRRTKFLPPAEPEVQEAPQETTGLVSEEAMTLLIQEQAGKAIRKARVSATKRRLEIASHNVRALESTLMEWF